MADLPDAPLLKEITSLLSVPDSAVTSDLLCSIERQYKRVKDVSTPKSVFSIFQIEVYDSHIIFDESFSIKGSNLADICRGCKKAALMAVTIGSSVDMLLRKSQAQSMSESVIFDACASAETERTADIAEEEIMGLISSNEFLTMRFSPGYGDVPLCESEKIISALNADKKIGLNLTKTNMLIPLKSITAVIGISTTISDRKRDCGFCSINKNCIYRKKGEFCGIQNK